MSRSVTDFQYSLIVQHNSCSYEVGLVFHLSSLTHTLVKKSLANLTQEQNTTLKKNNKDTSQTTSTPTKCQEWRHIKTMSRTETKQSTRHSVKTKHIANWKRQVKTTSNQRRTSPAQPLYPYQKSYGDPGECTKPYYPKSAPNKN